MAADPRARPALTPAGDAITVCIAGEFSQDWIDNKGAATLNSNCSNCATTLTAHVAESGTYSYQWKKNVDGVITTLTETGSQITVTPDVNTTYEVIVTNTNNTQQTGSDTEQVTIKPSADCHPNPLTVSLTASSNSVCPGNSTILTAHVTESGTYSYQWKKNVDGVITTLAGTGSQITFTLILRLDQQSGLEMRTLTSDAAWNMSRRGMSDWEILSELGVDTELRSTDLI